MRLRAQQIVIELANGLHRLLQFLIIGEPAANLDDPLATHAELPRAAAHTGHRQYEHSVPFTAGAFRTVFGMSDRALQQRATQQFTANRQLADEPVARSNGPIANHSLE